VELFPSLLHVRHTGSGLGRIAARIPQHSNDPDSVCILLLRAQDPRSKPVHAQVVKNRLLSHGIYFKFIANLVDNVHKVAEQAI
jgi:hypothetical protein